MLDPDHLAALLRLLHRDGYRLRKLGDDVLEVSDAAAPNVGGTDFAKAGEEDDRKDAEDAVWDHVGGRPRGLRSPSAPMPTSPWVDREGPTGEGAR
jgi:hypothetical protein